MEKHGLPYIRADRTDCNFAENSLLHGTFWSSKSSLLSLCDCFSIDGRRAIDRGALDWVAIVCKFLHPAAARDNV